MTVIMETGIGNGQNKKSFKFKVLINFIKFYHIRFRKDKFTFHCHIPVSGYNKTVVVRGLNNFIINKEDYLLVLLNKYIVILLNLSAYYFTTIKVFKIT